MTKQIFLKKLEELLQVDYALEENMSLSNIEEYDSLALLSLTVFYDQEFNIFVEGKKFKSCQKISDLIALIPSEKLESE
ncbi:TPA: acyl carrier protein [Campylobacter lari]|uniref:acyl carrier protein n=1 Tax=Campylobacter lari TaxID=201 RepID=UPI00180AB8DF|nr:acyl carrier protein [Campylobacter lari]EAI8647089.1 acyl carrier protein [Campylobacter lari]EIY6494571.1 acyl carrier protein [Campylobacter lari]EKK0831059.1 acyl carrier protein [Campylobacter lari]ELW5250963.1 acyl carrier protein [Campylobacter lari]MCV3399676.1 acyl carrier protein [Campylobacter lari]